MQTAARDLIEWGVKGEIEFLPTYKEGWRGRQFVAGQKCQRKSNAARPHSRSRKHQRLNSEWTKYSILFLLSLTQKIRDLSTKQSGTVTLLD